MSIIVAKVEGHPDHRTRGTPWPCIRNASVHLTTHRPRTSRTRPCRSGAVRAAAGFAASRNAPSPRWRPPRAPAHVGGGVHGRSPAGAQCVPLDASDGPCSGDGAGEYRRRGAGRGDVQGPPAPAGDKEAIFYRLTIPPGETLPALAGPSCGCPGWPSAAAWRGSGAVRSLSPPPRRSDANTAPRGQRWSKRFRRTRGDPRTWRCRHLSRPTRQPRESSRATRRCNSSAWRS